MIDFLKIDDMISDEMLATYIDGNATEEERILINNTLANDALLNEAVDIVKDSQILEENLDWDSFKDDFRFLETGSSPVMEDNEATDEPFTENIIIKMNDADMHVYGESGENISDPVFILQPDNYSCALRSQQIVLRDFGIDIPFDQLEQIALRNGIYTNEGTFTSDIGKVLELAGIGIHQVQGTTLSDLMDELAQGHRVIVSVDAHELWDTGIWGRMKNWLFDVLGNQGGNHALIVAGVEVNPNDLNDINVVLTDPGTGHLRIEYPVDQFMDAWKDSDCFMVATDIPAPYQYDVNTGKEIPSNFSVQQYVNRFIEDNSYQLSPDQINIPLGYQPAFTGKISFEDVLPTTSYNSAFTQQTEIAGYNQETDSVIQTIKEDDSWSSSLSDLGRKQEEDFHDSESDTDSTPQDEIADLGHDDLILS